MITLYQTLDDGMVQPLRPAKTLLRLALFERGIATSSGQVK